GLSKDKPAATVNAPAPATNKPAAAPASSGHPVPAAKPATSAPTSGTTARPSTSAPSAPTGTVQQTPAAAPVAPKAISEVDVVKQLEQKAKGTGLNWKQSIVDLLTLL